MYRFCRIGNTNLICYRNGTILRFHKQLKKWNVCYGYKNSTKYLQIEIDDKTYKMHRILAHAFRILDLHSPLKIDHRDRNPSNNCIFNLRPATQQQNTFNTNAKGYHWKKNNKKWQAVICINGKKIYLGLFDTEEDARQAYIEAKKKYHILGV
jgi:hypothetical protein